MKIKKVLTSKSEILEKIDFIKTSVKKMSQSDVSTSVAFYETFFSLLDEFKQSITDLILFDKLEADWNYEISFSFYKFELQLVHRAVRETDEDIQAWIDQVFTLYSLDIPVFTVEEYASRYSTDAMTIRQWIRRGKLRCAKKNGRDWVIPAVAVLPKRGTSASGYFWGEELLDIPREFKFIAGKRYISISQNIDKRKFDISMKEKPLDEAEVLVLDANEKEKLELYLISNDKVSYNMFYEQSVIKDIMNCFI